ncbi:hypothetical protein [Rhizobium sp. Root483D2]|uniref:hypothetical protein n=1 Tax=Rhizobium sp. Root483D2 TaxID=1736545 RepID=UPI000714D9B1|nr:hypothetical protein [Rhizobium sp. Root483D2]KQY21013.1 hypothetical protein ASD32_06435 [Rhizobium sp. Root483D2]
MSHPPLTPEKLDALLSRVTAVTSRDTSRIIWTLPAIGRRIGVGTDFVRDTLAKQEGSPVREIGGRYYAFEDELIAFLRR